MRAVFTDEQLQIEQVMLAMAGHGQKLSRAAVEKGWSAPEFEPRLQADFGSLGLAEAGSGLIDLIVAVEALARRLAPTRFVAQAAAIQLAAAAGLDVAAASAGSATWSPAVNEPGNDGLESFATTVQGGRITGRKTLVAYPGGVDALVVAHRDGVALVAAPPVIPRVCLDPARPMADVILDAPVIAAGPAPGGLARAALLAAADLCGAGRGALELGASYARERHQFGRPIGSFQGVAFQLADAFVSLKTAWDLTLYAAWAVQEGVPGAAGHVHAAKAKAGQAALFAAERTIQVFGGMGITWEADPHLYLRRVLVADVWLGTGAWHRRQVGRMRLRTGAGGAR